VHGLVKCCAVWRRAGIERRKHARHIQRNIYRLAAKLRPANIDASAGTVDELARIVSQIRTRWPGVRIVLRADSGKVVALADTISDFLSSDGDKIDLSAIDANITNGSGDDVLTFIGSAAFSGTAGELRFEVIGANVFVSADLNGDTRIDFAVNVNNTPALVAADFVL